MRTRKRFGQHFLEPVWADKVVDAIAPAPDDVFLEIGPGPGILTLKLAPKVSRLVAIEIDRDLIAELTPRLPSNASIVAGDVLDIDLDAALPPKRCAHSCRRQSALQHLVADSVSSARARVAAPDHRCDVDAAARGCRPHHREVPERLSSACLSVLVQWRADVSRLLAIPPGAFRPPPDVRSAPHPPHLPAAPFRAAGPGTLRTDGPQHVYAAAKDARQRAWAVCRSKSAPARPLPWPPPASTHAGGPRRWRLLK